VTAPRECVPYDFGTPFKALVRRGFERAHARKPEPGELSQAWKIDVDAAGKMFGLVAVWAAPATLCPFNWPVDQDPAAPAWRRARRASACAGANCSMWIDYDEEYGCCAMVEATGWDRLPAAAAAVFRGGEKLRGQW
jgi:hypothetical protein